MASQTPNKAFQLLAIETNAHIASYLNDQDLCRFASTCRCTRNAVHCDRSPVWRSLFMQHFDLVPGSSNNDLKSKYQERTKILRRGAKFAKGNTEREKRCLLVLRDLIVESYLSGPIFVDNSDKVTSLNIQQIERFLLNTDILQNILLPRNATCSHLMSIIQILIANFRLDLAFPAPTYGFPDSRKMVYETARTAPLFIGKERSEINLQWIGAAINYFKYHLTDRNQSLYDFWTDLQADQKPKAWTQTLKNGVTKLGRRWKGIYGFIDSDEIEKIRTEGGESDVYDSFNENERSTGPFQTMVLDLSNSFKIADWPTVFESHLRSVTHPSKRPPGKKAMRAPQTRSGLNPSETPPRVLKEPKQAAVKQFAGIGKDFGRYYARGWLNELPSQQGIPGWMRITMMKFFTKEEEEEDDDEANGEEEQEDVFGMKTPAKACKMWDLSSVNVRELWGYEGVVLPGGQIMVGRWWDIDPMDPGAGVGFGPKRPEGLEDTECYCGPFIFWCVDGADEDDDLDLGML